MKSPYDILGLDAAATATQVKRAFRRLARLHHPDHNPGDPEAARRFREVREAFALLGDPEQRARYDRGHGPCRGGFDGVRFDVESLLGELLGRSRCGASVAELVLDLREAVVGGSHTVDLEGAAREVVVPPGTRDGDVLAVAGDGVVSVQVRPHAVFERKGDDLHVEVPITIGEALLGAKVPVPTLSGAVRVTLPAGTQSGAQLRLKGKGVAREGCVGDLYVRLVVRMPTEVDPVALQEVLQALERCYTGDVRAELMAAA